MSLEGNASLKDILNRIIDNRIQTQEIYSILGTVKSVDLTTNTCDVTPIGDNIADVLGVRLNNTLSTSAKGLITIPKVGSVVTVTFLSKSDAFVSMFSEIDSYALKITDDVTLEVSEGDKFVFNGGALDGMCLVNDVVTRLNNIENDINTLKTAFTSWVTVPNDGGAALKAVTASWYGSSLILTNKSDIENTDIKQ